LENQNLSARNHSEPPRDGAGDRPVPVLHPEAGEKTGALEVVWSSPVSTGAGFGRTLRTDYGTAVRAQAEEIPEWNRHVFAFESDLLDGAFVHWEEGNQGPTLEMIPGFKKESAPEIEHAYLAESVASGLGDVIADDPVEVITRLDTVHTLPLNEDQISRSKSDSTGRPGPNRVRTDGIEDPLTGWRPTGMVFFETLATPPRGTIYSSSLLEAFLAENKDSDNSNNEVLYHGTSKPDSVSSPFFDFPDVVAPAPPDDTEDFPVEVVVRGGRRGGGGNGVWIFRAFGRMILILLALAGLGAMALAGSYIYYIKQRLYDGEKSGRFATVVVKPGDGFRTVIDSMHAEGLLSSFMGLDDRYIMRYLAYAYENSDKVKPGVYKFDTGQNLQDAYDKLINGSKDYKITIPEGKTAKEVAELVGKQYTTFDPQRFLQLTNDPEFIQELKVDAPTLEGYLYPSTYYFGPGMKEEELIRLMVGTFQDKAESLMAEQETTTGLSFHEHVIMASLIEREARMDEDRPLIASVIFNRLRQGIPLQIDATVNYALNNWRRLSNADYKTDHPYNTYKFKGLPPGPIASPRIESLSATFRAPETDYLYYVHKGDGHHAFAETYAQHQANVGRYIRERYNPGMGNAPTEGEGGLVEKAAVTEKAPSVAGAEVEDGDVDLKESGRETKAEKEKADEPKKTPEASTKETPKAKSY